MPLFTYSNVTVVWGNIQQGQPCCEGEACLLTFSAIDLSVHM